MPAKYVVYKKRLSWSEAETTCLDMGMEFAVVSSEEDNLELQAEANRNIGSPYKGSVLQNFNKVSIRGVMRIEQGRFEIFLS